MKGRLLFRDRYLFGDGAIMEMTLGEVPDPVIGSSHRLKYSLFYGYPGKRVIGYDNERGKGDHRHLHGREQDYPFTSVERLIADFLADVQHERARDGDQG